MSVKKGTRRAVPPSASPEKRTKAGLGGIARKRNLTISKLYINPGQSVSTDDQDILDAAVLETGQDRKPVLGTFILADFDRQDFFLSVAVDFQDDISSQLFDDSVVTDREMDCIDEQDWINLIKGPVLPFLNLWQEPVSYIRY